MQASIRCGNERVQIIVIYYEIIESVMSYAQLKNL